MSNLALVESHQNINQTSGEVELYTPENIIELARKVLGTIDLDPASCAKANEIVKATNYFTKEDDGLSKRWFGKVWMNHPFHKGEKACSKNCKKKNCIPSKPGEKQTRGHCITEDIPSNADWLNKLIREYHYGCVEEAICITFSSMSEGWMVPLLEYPQCFPKGRTHYRNPDGTTNKQATKGSLITYMGPNPELFERVFGVLGKVK